MLTVPCTRRSIVETKKQSSYVPMVIVAHFSKLYSMDSFWGGKVHTFRIKKVLFFSLPYLIFLNLGINIRLLTQRSLLEPSLRLKTKSMKWQPQLISRLLKFQDFHVLEMATPVSPNLSRVSADSQHNDNNTSSGEMVRFDTNCTMLRVTNISIVIHY